MRVWDDNFTGDERVYYTFHINKIQPFPLPNGPILDWGCSIGKTTEDLVRIYPGRRIIGIDINPHVIEIAKSRGLECYCMDGCEIKEKLPGPYAGIFAMNNLAYGLKNNQITEDQFKQIIGSLVDCLIDDGYLILSKDFQLWIYGKREKGLVYCTPVASFGKLKNIRELISSVQD